MSDFTIISYPGTKDQSLLSLSERRSRYMIPFGGKFRVVDFTLRNSFSCRARSTIIYNSFDDGLEDYVNLYGPFEDEKFPPIKVISKDYSDISHCYDIIMEANSGNYLIYNGDNPSLIDFNEIINHFRSNKSNAVLYLLNENGTPTMAYRVLAATQEVLLEVINEAVDQKRNSPNIFEMIMNMMIHRGVRRSTFDAVIWPFKSVTDYYDLNWKVISDRAILDLMYRDKIIKSKIIAEGYARVGQYGKIISSFMSDYCMINGTVENSIIYPGVEIHEGAYVKDSIILPFVKIGPGARVIKTIVDERTANGPDSTGMNISSGCRIGSEDSFIKNTKYPLSLNSSITLIGKDCALPQGIRVGGGCYIPSESGEAAFAVRKNIPDGDCI